MGRPADVAARDFKPTLFNRISAAIAAGAGAGRGDAPIALHVGDTWLDLPPELGTPLAGEDEPWAERLSRYGDTQGEPELRRRLVAKLRARNALPVSDPREIQVTFGSTGALFLAMTRLLEPGDEILTLAPEWTMFKVVASAARIRLVEVPCFDRLAVDPAGDLGGWLAAALTPRTRAIYFNSPNNPTGVMLRRAQLEALAHFAREHDLWVLADEAYEDFVWCEEPYLSIAALPDMFERTVSIFSASKSYAAAGLRLGYAAAPRGVIATLNPGQVAAGYEPNRPAQVMAIRALAAHDAIRGRLRETYRQGLEAALTTLRVPHLPADGGYYLFLDLRERWAGLGEDAKLERMLGAGVIVSPGEHFGADYDGWARFCFTSEPPERVAEAARRANQL